MRIRIYFTWISPESGKLLAVNEEMAYLQFGLNLLSATLLCMMFYMMHNNSGRGGPKGGRP
jgi:hypothetical protein